MASTETRYDALIIGAGPSGTVAALCMARLGLRALILEKAVFPRFQIGESLLPRNWEIIEELGLEPYLKQIPHLEKLGAEFTFGDRDEGHIFRFNFGLSGGVNRTINMPRADFDQALLKAALDAGAEIEQPATVRHLLKIEDGDVQVELDDGRRFQGRYLLDCSGQATVVARHLGLRQPLSDPHLSKVAYYEHYTGAFRHPGDVAGFPTVAMADEGWFWMIPLDEHRTSVGLVIDPKIAKATGVPANRMLAWGIQRSPFMRERMVQAQGPVTNRVCADFSYRCEPYAGPGYFLVGDAAAFLDPVFSSGVCLGMVGGQAVAEQIYAMLHRRRSPAAARRHYIRKVAQPTRHFERLIRHYYVHRFRELFLHGKGPLGVHRAVLEVLAGRVFPRPAWSVQWRLWIFELFVRMQGKMMIVPEQAHFSLCASEKVAMPLFESGASESEVAHALTSD